MIVRYSGRPSRSCSAENFVRVQGHQLCTVVRKCIFWEARYNILCGKICTILLTKFNRLKNWRLLTMHSEDSSLSGLRNNKWMLSFRTKSLGFQKDREWLLRNKSNHWVAGGIIGSLFLEHVAGQTITVTGTRHRHILNRFFVPKLQNVNVDDMQLCMRYIVGATWHTAQ